MNKNIDKMISKVITDPKLRKSLTEQRTFDDVYEFCSSVSGGYTKKELENFFDEILDYSDPLYEEMEDEHMASVAGGINKNIYAKILAYSLSMLTLASSSNVGATSSTSQPGEPVKSASVQDNKESFWKKYKKIIIGLGLAGLLCAGVGSVYLWNKKSDQGNDEGKRAGKTSDGTKTKTKTKTKEQEEEELIYGYSEEHHGTDSGSKAQKIYRSLRSFIENLPLVGGALAFAGAGSYVLSDLGSMAFQIAKIDSATWPIQKLIEKFSDFRKRVQKNMNHEELSLSGAFDNLKYLFEEVKGQEKAKEQIKSVVYGILHRKNQAKLSGKKYGRGDVLYFTGPSGVGKTLMARGLAKYKILTSNTEPFYISASEVDKESTSTVIDQLFGLNSYGGYGGYDEYGSRGNRAVTTPKSLVKYLNNNPDGVVIVDEYDKMWSPNLDEIFRTIVDHGVVNVKGQTIDCSGITFILTSNESTKSIEGGNQDAETEEQIDDGTGSRTQVKHDKSFLNRLQPVEFSNLSSEEYIKIIKKEFKDELIGYWANPEVNGIEIVINDDCLKNMAKVVENKNQGARYITRLQSDLFRDISIKVFDAEVKEKDFYRGKKIFVEFNPQTEEFILKDNVAKQ